MSPAALTGRRVAVLRVGDRDDQVSEGLRDRGATASSIQVADVVDRPIGELLDEAGDLGRFAWVAVTSAHAARRLASFEPLAPTTRVGAVGPATRAALAAVGVRCDAVAPEGTAASLASCVDGGPVLFVASARARDDLPVALRDRGIDVTTIVAYDVLPRALDAGALEDLRRSDVVVVASPSALDAALDALHGSGLEWPNAQVVAIGPTTARHALGRRLDVSATAPERDAAAVVDAVASLFE